MAKNWAIVVGINHYEHHPERKLQYAVRDAELMRDFLIHHAQFDADQVIACLGDEAYRGQPTYPACGNLLRWLNRELHPRRLGQIDRFWFFFSGHGISENGQDYLIACDGLQEDRKRFALSIDEITAALRLHENAEIVLILDQCRERIGSKDFGSEIGVQTIELAKQRGITTIFSCDYGQYSYELETIQSGAFTYALVEGLKQHTLPAQLEPYLQRRVRELHQQAQKSTTQLPKIHLDSAQKANAPLLPDSVTTADISQLTEQAVDAFFANDLDLAERLWELVNDCAIRPQDRKRAIAAIKQIATVRQQKETERLHLQQKQQQEEAERLRLQQQRQQEAEQQLQLQQQVEAERLQQQAAERQRQQEQEKEAGQLRLRREEAERQRLIEQQQEAERQQRLQQQQEAERRRQEALQQQEVERQRSQANDQPRATQSGTRTTSPMTRQKFLKLAGFGGGGLVAALIIGNQHFQNSQTPSSPSKTDASASLTKLEELLKAGNWKAADQETLAVMLKIAKREKEGWLDVDSIKTFPCKGLQNIDQLWVKYSNGKFGFSVQKKIYLEVGGKPDGEYPGDTIWRKFGDRVGWRVKTEWISYSDINFSTSALAGHLPPLSMGGFGCRGGVGLLGWGCGWSLLSHPCL